MGSVAPATHASPRTALRITSFDVSRGIAISLMVVGHSIVAVENTSLGSSPFYSIGNEIFGTVRMPLFFFLAGVFLVDTMKKRGYRHWLADKAQYLLYPWLVWSLLRGILEVALYQVGIGGSLTLWEVAYGIVWEPRIWYLPALFVAFAVVGGCYAASRGWRWWPIPAFVLLIGLIILTRQPWWPPLLLVHPFTLCLLLGIPLGFLAIRCALLSRLNAGLIAVGSALTFALLVALLLPTGQLANITTWQFALCSIPGVVFFVALGRCLDGLWIGRILERLGRWSLIIYVANAVPVSTARTLLMKAGVEDYNALVLIPAAVGIAAPAVLALLIDRGHLRWLIIAPGYRKAKPKRARPAGER